MTETLLEKLRESLVALRRGERPVAEVEVRDDDGEQPSCPICGSYDIVDRECEEHGGHGEIRLMKYQVCRTCGAWE